MAERRGQTLPSSSRAAEDDDEPENGYLVRALQCDDVLATPTRHWLDGVERIRIGRHSPSIVTRTRSALDVQVDDPRLSTSHLEIVLAEDRRSATLRDLGSTNGSRVNGKTVVANEEVTIEDGDVIEAGHTFFVFRGGVARLGNELDDEASAEGSDADLTSLCGELESTLLLASRIAVSRVPVLLVAPTGTGKEVVARAMHRVSRRTGDFVAVNCAALPAALVESELFGHRRGAFSGALEDRPGLVRSADRGTLLLDEIGDLAPNAQAALLRTLQENEVLPVGATRPVPVDFRLIAATHRPLRALAEAGTFRGDLLARISGYELTLPTLRDRREDLGLLLGALLRRHAGPRASQVKIASAAARAMFAYDWPHNIRELDRMLEAVLVLADDGLIRFEHLPRHLREGPGGGDDADARKKTELVELLERHDWNVSAVARATGKARMQVQRWMKRYGLKAPRS